MTYYRNSENYQEPIPEDATRIVLAPGMYYAHKFRWQPVTKSKNIYMKLKTWQYVVLIGLYLVGGIVARLNHDIDGWATGTFFLVVACVVYWIWKRNYRKNFPA